MSTPFPIVPKEQRRRESHKTTLVSCVPSGSPRVSTESTKKKQPTGIFRLVGVIFHVFQNEWF